jgi:predicted HTH transcriptional regulator
MELVEILKRPEGMTLEFEHDLSSADGALQAIVVVANTSGGALLIGAEDRTRHVLGVHDAFDLEERLAST